MLFTRKKIISKEIKEVSKMSGNFILNTGLPFSSVNYQFSYSLQSAELELRFTDYREAPTLEYGAVAGQL